MRLLVREQRQIIGGQNDDDTAHFEDTPAYSELKNAGLLCTVYRRNSTDDIFIGKDLKANTSKNHDCWKRFKHGYYCLPGLGCILYHTFHTELFVPAQHVAFIMNDKNEYLFAQPGMHNISGYFNTVVGEPTPLWIDERSRVRHIEHGDRTIVIIEQGYIGLAFDNGQPVLLPPGIHVWTSDSLRFEKSVSLNDHIIFLGPYTLITVDEGYAAVTQNNGKQEILPGGATHLLTHKNWKFEKFMTLKIQTDELKKIQATSADNINMAVSSTVTWQVVNPKMAATFAAETMATSGRTSDVSKDIVKLRNDVLQQALASLAAFIGGVNYSESFHVSAAAAAHAARNKPMPAEARMATSAEVDHLTHSKGNGMDNSTFADNPLYDTERMDDAVTHANKITETYGVRILSINIISATPVDTQLTQSLAMGAVAAAKALQDETAARGLANAAKIQAEAEAEQSRITANGHADAIRVRAQAEADAEIMKADAEAEALRKISSAMNEEGGEKAITQRIAEQYIGQLSSMARNSNMMIVPDRPNDISGVITTALGIGATVSNGMANS